MQGSRRTVVVVACTSLLAILPAAVAWACVGVVSLRAGSSGIGPVVQPGGTLEVSGKEFAANVPIEIRLGSPTGRVLATVPGPSSTMNSSWTVPVTVPSDLPNGRHLLVAIQNHHDMNSGAPARSVFYVGAKPLDPPPAEPRPATMIVDSGPSFASLAIVALGVAALGLVAAAGWAFAAGREPGKPRPATN